MTTKKFVYLFSEGNGNMRELLGGKGANLAEMTKLSLPVPPGFTITTDACNDFYENGQQIRKEIIGEIFDKLRTLEQITEKKFGDKQNPLLVSVRSGARASMPGMMDTILNLGINDEVVQTLISITGNDRWAWDCYRRFIQMYSDVVMQMPKEKLERLIDEIKKEKNAELDTDLKAEDLKELTVRFKEHYKKEIGEEFPADPKDQLIGAVKAVFRSWNNDRAIYYRRMNDIPASWGTAVNIQSMVFGNSGDTSGTGVAFTRDPSSGEKKLVGEYLINAQGEDVVAGIRTPEPISKLRSEMPEIYAQFEKICEILEEHYKDMQDMEFTIEKGKLFMLQTRNGKRTATAALKIACDLIDEGKRSETQALLMLDPKTLDSLLHGQFDSKIISKKEPIGEGLAASPGAACGKIVFSAADAVKAKESGINTILVRLETSPEDIEGMHASQGVLTVRGGMTSHAAVVARGMGRCCVSGCSEISINEEEKFFTLGSKKFCEYDVISIDGSTGKIYDGSIPMSEPKLSPDFERIMELADKYKSLKIRTNADTPNDVIQAVKFGAQGVGLCRTEHMFFEKDRISTIRRMICASTSEDRKAALEELEPMQQSDFEKMYTALGGRPMTVRFLDPPLHEFLPKEDDEINELANTMGKSKKEISDIIASLHEFNPMMGHRGCRLLVTYPEITIMQTKAVIRAAIKVKEANPKYDILPEIMIPLIGDSKEFAFIKKTVKETADSEIKNANSSIKYKIGTMIEVPRAALCADEIAKEAEFFSFGTNDLTQMTFGFSRDDAGKFLKSYYDNSLYEFDPFARIDESGVGKLISIAAQLGRKANSDLKIGICGEQGGDPASVEFCHKTGLDYVSVSPFRVPIARLAAAQAAIKNS